MTFSPPTSGEGRREEGECGSEVVLRVDGRVKQTFTLCLLLLPPCSLMLTAMNKDRRQGAGGRVQSSGGGARMQEAGSVVGARGARTPRRK